MTVVKKENGYEFYMEREGFEITNEQLETLICFLKGDGNE